MDIHKDSSGALVFSGKLVVSEIEGACSKVEPLLDETLHETVLDLSDVDDIDISGLQLVLAMKKAAVGDGSFRIRGASAKVREIVFLAGFDGVFEEDA